MIKSCDVFKYVKVQRVTYILFLSCYEESSKVNGCWGRDGHDATSLGHWYRGSHNGGYSNKPSWLTLVNPLMIRGLTGKDPFKALAR